MATNKFNIEGSKIWVTGHNGMVGSALLHRLEKENCEILSIDRNHLDLTNQEKTQIWLKRNKPDAVFLVAAKVGGILANDKYPADFIYNNLAIETNIIHGSYLAGVKKLVFLGSSCIYPKTAKQPIKEECLLSGPLEPTNQWYAIAKIAGIKMCQAYRRQYGCDYISAMPANLFGPGDNYDEKNSHVIAALIQKMHRAKITGAKFVEIWGTGKPLREFLFVDDLADALVFLLKNYSGEAHINVGSGTEHTILELAQIIAKITDFNGKLIFDTNMIDGTPRKFMDSSRLTDMGWKASTELKKGLKYTYKCYLENIG